MNSLPAESSSVSWLRVAADLLFSMLFLTLLTAGIADLILEQFLEAGGALVLALAFAWAGRGMLKHLDRWSANWDE